MHRRGNMREPRGAESVVKHLDVPETRAIELVEAEKEDDHDDHADQKPGEDVDHCAQVEEDEDAILEEGLHDEWKTDIGWRKIEVKNIQ